MDVVLVGLPKLGVEGRAEAVVADVEGWGCAGGCGCVVTAGEVMSVDVAGVGG